MTISTPNFAARLEAVLGCSRVSSDPSARSAYAVDEIVPAVVAKPSSAEETAEIVRFALLEKLAIIPSGNRTKLAMGRPALRYDIALDTAEIHQIAHYDPGDLTVSVDAGMPLAKLNAFLSEHQQFVPLLVPWYSRATIGGTIASGIHSPLQQFYGTARDFLIGAEFVTGSGAPTKSGGRVVKNVTGYDLHKLLIGSLGTLAVITRLNFRTFPMPVASRGFVASFRSAAGALAMRHAITDSSLAPLTLDILSPELAAIFASRTPATPETSVFAGENRVADDTSLPRIGDWFRHHEWQLCAAFAGPPGVGDRYERELTRLAEQSKATSTAILDDATRPAVWGRLREILSMLLEASPATVVFKISVLPGLHATLFESLRRAADRAGFPCAMAAGANGTIYFALFSAWVNDETTMRLGDSAAEIRNTVSGVPGRTSANHGYSTLLFAPLPWKHLKNLPLGEEGTAIDLWGPKRTDHDLMRRIKSAFDPQDVFAPGRLFGRD